MPTFDESKDPDYWDRKLKVVHAIALVPNELLRPIMGRELVRTEKRELKVYLEELRRHFVTQFDGHKGYGLEDDMFLGDQISRVAGALFALEEAGL